MCPCGLHRDWWDPEGRGLGWGQGQRSLRSDLTGIRLDKWAGSPDCPGQRLHCLSKLRRPGGREALPALATSSRGWAPHHHPLTPLTWPGHLGHAWSSEAPACQLLRSSASPPTLGTPQPSLS